MAEAVLVAERPPADLVLPQALSHLGGQNLDAKLRAIRILGYVGPGADRVVPTLVQLLASPPLSPRAVECWPGKGSLPITPATSLDPAGAASAG